MPAALAVGVAVVEAVAVLDEASGVLPVEEARVELAVEDAGVEAVVAVSPFFEWLFFLAVLVSVAEVVVLEVEEEFSAVSPWSPPPALVAFFFLVVVVSVGGVVDEPAADCVASVSPPFLDFFFLDVVESALPVAEEV
jgi:hypothetical protein